VFLRARHTKLLAKRQALGKDLLCALLGGSVRRDGLIERDGHVERDVAEIHFFAECDVEALKSSVV